MNNTTHWAQIKESGSMWGMKFLLYVYLHFGRLALQILFYPIVICYWFINTQARHASQNYLNRLTIFAPSLKLHGSFFYSCKHFISFADAIIDKVAAWAGLITLNDVQYCGRNKLITELKKGRGIILLGSHLGNLEVCRVISDFDKTIKINVLMHNKHAQKFNQVLKQTNNDSQLNIIQVTEVNAATAILLSDKIDNGELIIIAADRTPVNNQQRVNSVTFLGAEALFPQGPFILANLLKCPIYTIFCLKHYNKYTIYFDLFSNRLKFSRKTREQELQQTIQRYAICLQTYCLKVPLQWFNFFDFWRIM